MNYHLVSYSDSIVQIALNLLKEWTQYITQTNNELTYLTNLIVIN
jgi:hypothetical protein